MRRLSLALVLLLPLAACDSQGDARTYDLSFFDTDGAFVARLQFDELEPLACDALDCNASDWRLVEGETQNAVTQGQRRGTLRGIRLQSGWDLILVDGIDDGGTTATIGVGVGGDVTGTWSESTIAGPRLAGTVSGSVE